MGVRLGFIISCHIKSGEMRKDKKKTIIDLRGVRTGETGYYSTVQYSAGYYSTVQCSTVQYSTVQYRTERYSTV